MTLGGSKAVHEDECLAAATLDDFRRRRGAAAIEPPGNLRI